MLSQTILIALAAGYAAAQTTTVPFFIPKGPTGIGFAGSVLGACAEETTYVLTCTSDAGGQYDSMYAVCSSGASPFTYTVGPSTYNANTIVVTEGDTATVAESCKMTSSSMGGECTATLALTIDGSSTATQVTTSLAADEIQTYQVVITAGAEKLNATGSCSGTTHSKSGADIIAAGTGLLGLVSLAGMVLL